MVPDGHVLITYSNFFRFPKGCSHRIKEKYRENMDLDFHLQSLLLPVVVYIRIREFCGERCDLGHPYTSFHWYIWYTRENLIKYSRSTYDRIDLNFNTAYIDYRNKASLEEGSSETWQSIPHPDNISAQALYADRRETRTLTHMGHAPKMWLLLKTKTKKITM